MTDALADHLLEHGVRRPPAPRMPVLPARVSARCKDSDIADDAFWERLGKHMATLAPSTEDD